MPRSTPALCAAAILLSACANAPSVRQDGVSRDDYLSAANILYSARCEFRAATEALSGGPGTGKEYRDLVAAFTLKLTVKETVSSAGGVAFSIPIGPATVGHSATITPKNTDTRIVDFTGLLETGDPPGCTDAELASRGFSVIEPGLGLEAWLTEIRNIKDWSGAPAKQTSYKATFEINRALATGTSYQRKVPDAETYTFSISPGGSRVVTHELNLTLSEEALRPSARPGGRLTPNAEEDLLRAHERFLDRSSESR